jgi:hypothetical protein
MRTSFKVVGVSAAFISLTAAGPCDPEYDCQDFAATLGLGERGGVATTSGCFKVGEGGAIPWNQVDFLFEGPSYLTLGWSEVYDQVPMWTVADNAPTGPATVTYRYVSNGGNTLGEGKIRFTIECTDCRNIEMVAPTNGYVTGPNGFDCGGERNLCQVSYRPAQFPNPQLTAYPASGYQCGAWVGCTPSSADPCVANIDPTQDASCSIMFEENSTPRATLDIEIIGSGDVSVLDASEQQITCTEVSNGKSCRIVDNTSFTLRASASPGWVFSGWSGGCSGMSEDLPGLTMSGDRQCTATFTELGKVTLTLGMNPANTGAKLILTDSTGQPSEYQGDTSFTVSRNLFLDTDVSVEAVVNTGDVVAWRVKEWRGDCMGTGNTTTFRLTSSTMSCEAVFEQVQSSCNGATAPVLSVQVLDSMLRPIVPVDGAYSVGFEETVQIDLSGSDVGSNQMQRSVLYVPSTNGGWTEAAASSFSNGDVISWRNTQLRPSGGAYDVRIDATNDCGLQASETVTISVPF